MARQKYELNGTIYNVNLDSEEGQAWLNGDGKNATLLDPEQGKNQSSVEDATAEQNPTASDSQSGTTSSDSQKVNTPFLDFTNPLFSQDLGNKVINFLSDSEERGKAAEFIANGFRNLPEKMVTTFSSYLSLAMDVNRRQFEVLGLDNIDIEDKDGNITNLAEIAGDASKKGLELANKLNSGERIDTELGTLQMKDTGKGIVKGVKDGSIADIIGGFSNAIYGTAETVIPAAATGGLSLIPQMTGPMYVSYNTAKAKALYGKEDDAIDKLYDNGEAEVAIPMALGAVAYGLEKIGFDGIMSYAIGKGFANNGIGKLFGTMIQEGTTELLQGGVTKFNDEIGAQSSVKEASEKAWDHMSSDEGLEEFLMGVVGGGTMSAGGRALNRAFRNDAKSIKFVNDSIDRIAELNRVRNKSKSKAFRESIKIEIDELTSNLKSHIENSRSLKNYLTEEQKSNMLDLLKQKDNIETKKKELLKELNQNKLSKKDYGYALRSLNNQSKKISESLFIIKKQAQDASVDRNIKFA